MSKNFQVAHWYSRQLWLFIIREQMLIAFFITNSIVYFVGCWQACFCVEPIGGRFCSPMWIHISSLILLTKWFSHVYKLNSSNSSGCQRRNLKCWQFFIAVIRWNQRRTSSTSHLPTVRFHPGRCRWRPSVSLFIQCFLFGQQSTLGSSSQQIRYFPPRLVPWGDISLWYTFNLSARHCFDYVCFYIFK